MESGLDQVTEWPLKSRQCRHRSVKSADLKDRVKRSTSDDWRGMFNKGSTVDFFFVAQRNLKQQELDYVE